MASTKLTVGIEMLKDAREGDFDSAKSTLDKLLANIVANPSEPKVDAHVAPRTCMQEGRCGAYKDATRACLAHTLLLLSCHASCSLYHVLPV